MGIEPYISKAFFFFLRRRRVDEPWEPDILKAGFGINTVCLMETRGTTAAAVVAAAACV
jgi:hypothetical protein